MRSTLRERWSEWKYSTERTLAPHVEEAWAEGLVLELRLQGVGGPAIGEALSEVESHCAESGETALDAFGDAIGYARSLRLPRSEDDTVAAIATATAPTCVQIVGMLATLWAFAAWAADEALDLTTGQVLSAVILLGVIAGIVSFSEPVLRFVVTHPVGAFFAFMTFSALAVVVPLLLQQPLATVPATPTLVLAAGVLVVGTVWERARQRSGADEDPITSPIAGPDAEDGTIPGSSPTPARGVSRIVALSYLMIPVYTVLTLGFIWWVSQQ